MHTQVLAQTGLSSQDEITIEALVAASETANVVQRKRNGVPEKHVYGSAYLRTEDGQVQIYSGYDLKDVLREAGFEYSERKQAWWMGEQQVGVCMRVLEERVCVCVCVLS